MAAKLRQQVLGVLHIIVAVYMSLQISLEAVFQGPGELLHTDKVHARLSLRFREAVKDMQ